MVNCFYDLWKMCIMHCVHVFKILTYNIKTKEEQIWSKFGVGSEANNIHEQ